MVLQHRKDRNDFRWRCNGKHCKEEFFPKAETWFQGCEHSVRTVLLFIQAWAEKMTMLAFCRATFDMNGAAAVKVTEQ
uniref:FLYWCH-type domain-containing protein n=1 Tax=Trichuris muris TaxID=70415 RepID=A0A5S6QUN1_TRIMR